MNPPTPSMVDQQTSNYICYECGDLLDGHMAMVKHARADHSMALPDAIDLAKRSRVLLGDTPCG